MGPNSTNMSLLRFLSFALLLVLLIHSAAARPLSEVVTEAVNDSPSVAADQEKIENVDARTNDKPALSDAVVPEDYLELSQMAARGGTEPQPCASCDQVPCGHCQDGCPGSDCSPVYSMDKPGSTSRNWCANNNAGLVPPQCRSEQASVATAATGSCASCDQVPCGFCQDGCPGSDCTADYPMDKPDSTSRNWCANNNAGLVQQKSSRRRKKSRKKRSKSCKKTKEKDPGVVRRRKWINKCGNAGLVPPQCRPEA